MSHALTSKLALLKDRAEMLTLVRDFFKKRGIMEVDVPILSWQASVDLHIDPIEATCCGKKVFLHTSPEYGMKRLLAEEAVDIYQISHVFRDNERGERHTVEFMMAEWYRMGFSFQQMIDETICFMRLFIDVEPSKIEKYGYKEAFLHFAGHFPDDLDKRDAVYAFEIEPQFSQDHLTLIVDFPPEQAALAQIGASGLAERFEFYYGGMELANGYHELIDPIEQQDRLINTNRQREEHGKEVLPIDHNLLNALERGLPDCCGVAVGFDRLMMLRHQLKEIREASCFFI